MRITFVIAGFAWGGAERVLCNLANMFKADGEEVTIVALSEYEKTYPIDNSIKIVNGLGWNNYFDGIGKLRKVILNSKPDVVVSFLVQVNIAVCMALLSTKIPVIVSERNDPAHMPSEKSRKILRWMFYRFSKGFVFQTEQAKHYFSKAIQKRSTVIPNPLFLDYPLPDIATRPHRIIAAARYVPQKNYLMMIKAFEKASKKNADWRLDIFGGDGSELPKLKEYVSAHDLEERVILNAATTEIHKEMGEHSIFLLSSNYEGMPNALMEAMGMGLACVSTNCPCGGPEFLIQSGKNGFLVPVDDDDAMAQELAKLMECKDLRISVANEATKIRDTLDKNSVFLMWKQYIDKIVR